MAVVASGGGSATYHCAVRQVAPARCAAQKCDTTCGSGETWKCGATALVAREFDSSRRS